MQFSTLDHHRERKNRYVTAGVKQAVVIASVDLYLQVCLLGVVHNVPHELAWLPFAGALAASVTGDTFDGQFLKRWSFFPQM